MASKSKNRKLSRTLKLSILAASLLFGFIIYKWIIEDRRVFVWYPEFGINMPRQYSMHGIDISHYQNNINWEAVSKMNIDNISISFAFIKATEGATKVDSHFDKNWRQSSKYNILRGAYHFFNASKSAEAQAIFFLKTVDPVAGDLLPVLDVETTNGKPAEEVQQAVKQWLDYVENAIGTKPIIYTNVDFYEKVLGSGFDDYPLWVAHYYQTDKPRIDRRWHFWQHSDKGNINGIKSKVDFNVFNGDSFALRRLLIK